MEIHVWSGDWGLSSIDYTCLELLTLVKISGAQAETKKVSNPFRTQVPVFRHNETKLTKFQEILTYLKNKNYRPDINLDNVQLAESFAYRNMIEDQLHPALRYIWWVDTKNYTEITRPLYAKMISFPLNYYYPGSFQRTNKTLIYSLHQDLEEVAVQDKVYKDAEKCLTSLSNRLGEENFFYGDHPTSLDAAVYGCIAPLLKAPFPPNDLQNHLKSLSNLVKFVIRITKRYFPQELLAYENKRKEIEKNVTKVDLFPNKRRNKIFAVLFAVVAMISYATSMGIFTLTINNAENDPEVDVNEIDD